MSPITHGLIGWLTANVSSKLTRKEMAIITIVGVIPDIDGLGLIAEFLTKNTSYPLLWWTEYHHILHNIGFALLVAIAAFVISSNRVLTAALAFVSFHLHLIGDLIGAGRRSVGDSLFIAFFKCLAINLVASMGTKCLAKLCHYRNCISCNFFTSL